MRSSPSRIIGGLKLDADSIRGWGWNSDSPLEAVTVELRTEREILGTVKADSFAPEMAELGFESTLHGFTFRIPPGRISAFPASIKARILELDSDIPGSLIIATPEDAAKLADPFFDITSEIEGIEGGYISGYVYNNRSHKQRYTVELRIDDKLQARAQAFAFRPDLLRLGIGDGCYGFRVPLSLGLLQGQGVTVSLALSGTRHEITGSPLFVGMLTLPAALASLARRIGLIENHLSSLVSILPDGPLSTSEREDIARLGAAYFARTEAISLELQHKIELLHSTLKSEIDARLPRRAE